MLLINIILKPHTTIKSSNNWFDNLKIYIIKQELFLFLQVMYIGKSFQSVLKLFLLTVSGALVDYLE